MSCSAFSFHRTRPSGGGYRTTFSDERGLLVSAWAVTREAAIRCAVESYQRLIRNPTRVMHLERSRAN